MMTLVPVFQTPFTSVLSVHAFKKALEAQWRLIASGISFVQMRVESLMQCQNHHQSWNRTLLFQIRWSMVQIMLRTRSKKRQTQQPCIRLAQTRRTCRVLMATILGLM